MNPSKLLSISAAALCVLVSPSFAQTTATTDPAGFITAAVAGGGSVASPRLSLISPTLMQPVAWQGAITAFSSPAKSLTVAGTPWTANQFNGAAGLHFVEIISNTGAANPIPGFWANILTTGTNVITTDVDMSAYAVVGAAIRIRKHVTIGSFFGATNSAGFLASDDASTADEVLVYSGAASTSYFYFTGGGGFPAGWYDAAFNLNPGQAENVAIAPFQGVVIKRKAAAALNIVSIGSVKTGNTLTPVQNALNVLGTVSAKGLTLGNSGLYTGNPATGVKASDDPSTADEVTIYTPTGQTNYFYFTGGGGFAAGWYDSAFNATAPLDSSVAIPAGTSVVVNRKGGGSFNWPLPSPTSF